ncbi:MAG: lysylphosphatidylglycerol synthase domain-containing protein, partial [Acidobacteriota bacterium]
FIAIHMVADKQDAFTLSFICLATSGLVVLLLFARAPLLPRPVAFVSRVKALPERWLSMLDKAGEMERQMRSFRLRHRGAVVRILSINLLVQIVMLAEVWMVLSAVGVPVYFSRLVAIEAASRLVKMLSFYVPGRLGADEAGAAGSFLVLGLDPAAGLTLALARRAQGICWAAVGLAWLGRGDTARKPSIPSVGVAGLAVFGGQRPIAQGNKGDL